MPRVAFSSVHDYAPWMRQTPDGRGGWGDWRFSVTREAMGYDWLVVFDELQAPIRTDLPRERRVLMITETPGIKVYAKNFMNQFGVLMSPITMAGYEGVHIETDVGFPWIFGLDLSKGAAGIHSRWRFDELVDLPYGEKRRELSAVISTKTILPRHRKRVEFVNELAGRIGEKFRLFGRGFVDISDKAEAILPFTHHLSIENNTENGFFTEKITDSYLGWSIPIYSGSKDIEKYFPRDSLFQFDLDANDAIDRVINAFNTPVDEKIMTALAEARRKVFYEANIFARLADVLGALDTTVTERNPVVLHMNYDDSVPTTPGAKGWKRLLRRIVGK